MVRVTTIAAAKKRRVASAADVNKATEATIFKVVGVKADMVGVSSSVKVAAGVVMSTKAAVTTTVRKKADMVAAHKADLDLVDLRAASADLKADLDMAAGWDRKEMMSTVTVVKNFASTVRLDTGRGQKATGKARVVDMEVTVRAVVLATQVETMTSKEDQWVGKVKEVKEAMAEVKAAMVEDKVEDKVATATRQARPTAVAEATAARAMTTLAPTAMPCSTAATTKTAQCTATPSHPSKVKAAKAASTRTMRSANTSPCTAREVDLGALLRPGVWDRRRRCRL